MTYDVNARNKGSRFPLFSLDEQADLAEKHKVDTLLYCPNPWALRHQFINQDTGETVRARCNRWDCLFCGPRKVDTWRQLVKAAEPTLFLTHAHKSRENGRGSGARIDHISAIPAARLKRAWP